ncbi:CHAT domain-containing protein [Microcoleus sp. herbarium14]|uniref:CHAT domain-containing protein n=1 Tax=Microcoleus sp. herbarium14 TaxID=3055439 RepID=UPI002FD19703
MVTLRVIQHTESQPNHYRVEVTLEVNGTILLSESHFEFKVKEQVQENIRWYLEDFLQYPQDPAPKIADKVEQRMTEIGVELFEKVFHANDDTRQVWEGLCHHINDTRVEIVTGDRDATAIPWELIRDRESNMPLALRAGAFVRTNLQAVQHLQTPQIVDGKIRILVIICRPKGGSDVPFRSVATKLIKGLTDSGSEVFQLDVLRPPTYSQLEKVLRQAKEDGKSYHIVHFDGHGIYEDIKAKKTGKPPKKMRGYLIFENSDPQSQDMEELAHGELLGQLLAETGVSLLVLNACRSAYIEAPAAPSQTLADRKTSAYGSLAQEVMDVGVAGVVAMRYNVYVLTAAEFVANLYEAIAKGQNLGEAVTKGRLHLHAQPMREIAYNPLPLQDWTVPVVYEAAPVAIFPNSAGIPKQPFTFSQGDAIPVRQMLDSQLPKSPDAGFFGRDETLLALDRAFDTQSIVLLHAYAGSGKTSTASEFGRWYAQTGGVDGPVLFTSFERYVPLKQVLDNIGLVFEDWLEARGVHWLALNDSERRDKALEVLLEVSVLWIWDNVEPVAGFPAGTESAWSAAEQQELVDFLQEARQTKAKFLLTSRRDERGWLGELPVRIVMPPMPMQERVQLARAIAEKREHQLTEVQGWRPLLQFSQGNPLTIAVLVGQALRDGLKTNEHIENFVGQLRTGEAAIEDDEREGRSKSLGASLSYGFAHAFTEEERQQLALLYLFQGFVNVFALLWMSEPNVDCCIPAVRGLTWDAWIRLLDRATEVGLLNSLGEGFYTIHPTLPWYFQRLFAQYYLPDSDNNPELVGRAFVEAMSKIGELSEREYTAGNNNILRLIPAEEANLLHALKLAQTNDYWWSVTNIIDALRIIYGHSFSQFKLVQLVEEIESCFVDSTTGNPLDGRKEDWNLITQYRVSMARQQRKWSEAESLQIAFVNWSRQEADALIGLPLSELDDKQRNIIRTLGVSLAQLGDIFREQSKESCIDFYKEAISIYERIGEQSLAVLTALDFGHAYKNITTIRNLAQAEYWYQRSLELCHPSDQMRQGICLCALGNVAYERFFTALESGKLEEIDSQIKAAVNFYQKALALLPPNAMEALATTHNQLGRIYYWIGQPKYAEQHYVNAIRYLEATGHHYEAAASRYNVALAFLEAGRLDDAVLYAQAALLDYEGYSIHATAEQQQTRKLIAEIEQRLKSNGD